jgi:hypothetical protein
VKNILIFIFVISFSVSSFSQSIENSQRYNGVKEVTKIPDGMTYNEFLRLQREITWQRIAAAAFIPGYLHFYADHNKEGYYILAARLLASGVMIFASLDELKYSNSLNFFSVISDVDHIQARTERNLILFLGGTIINFIGFAIDWTHGDWLIENERNQILYKYGLKIKAKVNPNLSFYENKPVFGVNLSISF